MVIIVFIVYFCWWAFVWALHGNVIGVILNVFAAGATLRGGEELHGVENRQNPFIEAYERGRQRYRDEHKD